jgi:hypothetical protein
MRIGRKVGGAEKTRRTHSDMRTGASLSGTISTITECSQPIASSLVQTDIVDLLDVGDGKGGEPEEERPNKG